MRFAAVLIYFSVNGNVHCHLKFINKFPSRDIKSFKNTGCQPCLLFWCQNMKELSSYQKNCFVPENFMVIVPVLMRMTIKYILQFTWSNLSGMRDHVSKFKCGNGWTGYWIERPLIFYTVIKMGISPAIIILLFYLIFIPIWTPSRDW